MKEIDPKTQFESELYHTLVRDFGLADREATERELVVIGLLMRIYDLQLALLKHFDPATAEEIYKEHGEGGNYNPAMFIPDFSDPDVDTETD